MDRRRCRGGGVSRRTFLLLFLWGIIHGVLFYFLFFGRGKGSCQGENVVGDVQHFYLVCWGTCTNKKVVLSSQAVGGGANGKNHCLCMDV